MPPIRQKIPSFYYVPSAAIMCVAFGAPSIGNVAPVSAAPISVGAHHASATELRGVGAIYFGTRLLADALP
jgi:hypothetical protein